MKHSLKSILFSFSCPRKSAFIRGCFFLILFLASISALAQGGGKAEPNRIEFKRGTSSTTISGTVRNSEEAEYVLAAKKGQRLVIKLSNTPAKSSCFNLTGPDGIGMGLEYDCNWNYSKPLPATGDYLIVVSRPSTAKGTSKYRMTVAVR